MEADSYPQMAQAQWAELRRRGKYRVRDARALIDYWNARAKAYDKYMGGSGAGLSSEQSRFLQRLSQARELLRSPTETFEYRKIFEEAIIRYAIAIEQRRQELGWPVASFKMPFPDGTAPTPAPVPIPMPGSPIDPGKIPGPPGQGMGDLLKLALVAFILNKVLG